MRYYIDSMGGTFVSERIIKNNPNHMFRYMVKPTDMPTRPIRGDDWFPDVDTMMEIKSVLLGAIPAHPDWEMIDLGPLEAEEWLAVIKYAVQFDAIDRTLGYKLDDISRNLERLKWHIELEV